MRRAMKAKVLAVMMIAVGLSCVSAPAQNDTNNVNSTYGAGQPPASLVPGDLGSKYLDTTTGIEWICASITRTPTTTTCNWIQPPAAGAVLPTTPLGFSATPNFAVGSNASYTMTLSGNVTSATTSGTPQNGSLLGTTLIQDGTGGRTFAFPANFIVPVSYTFDTAANHTNALPWRFDGTFWNLISNSSGASGCTPGGSKNTLQKNSSGSCAGSTITDDGTTVTVASDQKNKGPNPYTDVTLFGVRATTTTPSANCTMSSGSAVATLSAASTFINGDGVICRGAGPAITMSTPGAPTVVASNNANMLGTGKTIANSGGANTDTYQVVAVDIKRGYTAASAATTIKNGAVTKGAFQVSVSSWTRSGNTVTITTSSAHNLVTGAMASITAGDPSINGNYIITVTGGSTFTYSSQLDTAAGAASAGSTGLVTAYFGNHISWTPVTGAWQYIIYRTTGTPKIVCVSYPDPTSGNLSADPLNDQCDDWGDTISAAPSTPAWASATPPVSAKNDDLITTIVSGAGTTTVTLAATASNNVAAQHFVFDDGPNLIAAVTAASGNTVYFPATANTSALYHIASVTTLPANTSVMQSGRVFLDDTLVLSNGGYTRWQGFPATSAVSGAGSFSWNRLPQIATTSAYPAIFAKTASTTDFSYVTMSNNGVNQGNLFLIDNGTIPAAQFDHVQFILSATDFVGECLTIRNNITGGANFNFRFVQFFAGPNITDLTQAPLFQATQGLNPAKFSDIFLNRRGMYIGAATTGIQLDVNGLYIQGGVMPTITLGNTTGGNPGVTVSIRNVIHDTTVQPLVNTIGVPSGTIASFNIFSNQPAVAGPGGITQQQSGLMTAGTTGSETVPIQGATVDGINSTTITAGPVKQVNTVVTIAPKYKLVVTSVPQPAPTCAVSAGGTLAIGTYTFQVAPVFPNLSEGPRSSSSTSCTTTGGNQTILISWTVVPGAVGYDLYRNGLSFQNGAPWVSGGSTTSYNWTGQSTNNSSGPTVVSGGPTEITKASITTPALVLPSTDGGGKVTITMPIGTASRTLNLPDTNVTPLALGTNDISHFTGAYTTGLTNLQNTIVSSSNQFTGGTAAAWNAAAISTGTNPYGFGNDQAASITLGTIGAGNAQVMACVHLQPGVFSGDCAGINTNSNTLFVQKFVSGGSSIIASVGITPAVGDWVTIKVVGTAITVQRWSGGVLVNNLSASDPAFTSGTPGVAVFSNTSKGVNFEAYTVKSYPTLDATNDWPIQQNFPAGITLGSTLGTALTNVSGNSGRVPQSSGTLSQNKGATFDANGNVVAQSRGIATSTYTNATTTASNITGLSFAVAASTNYSIHCDLYYQGSAATAGLDITVTGPASPTSVFYSYDEFPTATTSQTAVANSFGTKLIGNASVTATTNLHAIVAIGLVNGANAGTVQVQGSATGAGTVTVQAGSSCQIQ